MLLHHVHLALEAHHGYPASRGEYSSGRYTRRDAFLPRHFAVKAPSKQREQLRASLNLALRKRPVSTEQVDAAIERIEEKLLALPAREVASNRIGELVMRELKKLDKVAYVRFASVYRSFEDIDDFKTLVDEVR